MTRTVQCVKLGTTAEGLALPPFPGPLGERIFNTISKTAWQQWLGHQTMLINEYRLNLLDPEARKLLEKEMKRFLFSEES